MATIRRSRAEAGKPAIPFNSQAAPVGGLFVLWYVAEPKQIGWLVSPDGAVVKYDAALVKRERNIVLRTAADLHARARIGLVYVDEILKKCGWHCNCITQSTTAISLEIGKVSVDVSIRKPMNIAYVTSRPGWEYKREVVGKTPDITLPDGRVLKGQEIVRPTANVQIAGDFIQDPYVVQIISTSEKGDSTTPVYVAVNKEMGDPAVEVAKNVLLTIRNLVGEDKLKVQNVDEAMLHLQAEWEARFDLMLTSSGSQSPTRY